MTAEELLALLETSGLSFAYGKWDDPPVLPYGVYLYAGDNDLMADNVNYAGVSAWQVELYSKLKDPASEAAIEAVLKGADIPYGKTETYLDTEDLYEVLYTIQTF